MTPIDPNIALQAGQGITKLNPMGSYAQGIQIAEGRNRLQAFNARVAAGQDFQKSINPSTGEPNVQQFGASLAADPAAAYEAQNAHQAMQNNVLTQLQQHGQTLDQAIKRTNYFTNALAPLLAQKNPIKPADIVSIAGQAVADGILTPQEGAKELASMPSNPTQLGPWVKQLWGQAQSSSAQLQSLFPHPTTVNLGSTSQEVDTNPVTNKGIVGTQFRPGLTPGQAATPQTFTGSTGVPVTVPMARYAQSAGVNPQGAVIPPNGTPAPNRLTGAPTLSPASGNSLAPSSVPGVGPGGTVVGPQPGYVASQASQALGFAKIGNEMTADAQGTSQVLASVMSLKSEIDAANPGPASEIMGKIGGLAQEVGINLGPQATASQLMHKSQAFLVATMGGSPSNTDAKLFNAMAATPGTPMTIDAAKGAAGMITGAVRYKNAKASAWINSGLPATDGPKFAANFRKQYGAAPFVFASVPKEQQQRIWKSLNMAEKKAMFGQIQSAEQAGFIHSSEVMGQ